VTTTAKYQSVYSLRKAYNSLLVSWQKADSHQLINTRLLDELEQQILVLESRQQAENILQARLIYIEEQIVKLKAYLVDFKRFKEQTIAFFEEISHTLQTTTTEDAKTVGLHNSYYSTIQTQAKQLFDDFEAGRYWRSGIAASVDLLLQYIESCKYWQSKEAPVFSPPNKILHESLMPDSTVQNYLNKLGATALYDAKHLSVIKQAYYDLRMLTLIQRVRKGVHPLEKPLNRLRAALKAPSRANVRQALQYLSKYVKPTIIINPQNFSTVKQKVLDITGTTEPNTQVSIIVNKMATHTVKANAKGVFLFKTIELEFGSNKIQYYNHVYHFLQQRYPVLHLNVITDYLFMGLHDPLTQKAFEQDEIELIVRCASCHNFMYDFAIEENEGYCAMPKCGHKQFYRQGDPNFWVKY